MPPEFRDQPSHRDHLVQRRATGQTRAEADPAHALVVKLPQRGHVHGGVEHHDAPRLLAEGRQGLEQEPVVGPVGRGLDDYVAGKAETPLELAVILDAGIGGTKRRRGGGRKARIVDVMVAIGCVRGHLEARRLASGGPGSLLRARAPRAHGGAGQGGGQHPEMLSSVLGCRHACLLVSRGRTAFVRQPACRPPGCCPSGIP